MKKDSAQHCFACSGCEHKWTQELEAHHSIKENAIGLVVCEGGLLVQRIRCPQCGRAEMVQQR